MAYVWNIESIESNLLKMGIWPFYLSIYLGYYPLGINNESIYFKIKSFPVFFTFLVIITDISNLTIIAKSDTCA